MNLAAVNLVDISNMASSATYFLTPPGNGSNGRGVVVASVVYPVNCVAPVSGTGHPVLLESPRRIERAVVIAVRIERILAPVVLPCPRPLRVGGVIARSTGVGIALAGGLRCVSN